MPDIISFIASRASSRIYDTAMGRAFFRAAGVDVPEPLTPGQIVRHDRYEGAEKLMRQRYGVEL